MAEWLVEAGIGETRAALVADDVILEAAIELDDATLRPGDILPARLVRQQVAGRRGIVALADGTEALLEPLPAGLTEGGRLLVQIVREALAEPGRAKLAKARPAAADAVAAPAPRLADRLAASGTPVVALSPYGPDRLERAGWSELIDEATTGEIAFRGGGLRLSLTPAMTLFDVDGTLPLPELACAGAAAAGRAIRRMAIGGSIGIDLPTLAAKADRQAAAAALDAALPPPFERTAVNGFGFLQIVRPRPRTSLPERLRDDPVGAAARALLRGAERTGGSGPRTIVAAPPVVALLEKREDWRAALARRIGAEVVLRSDSALAISRGHVQAHHP
ncbi:MAG: hypothetical protein JWL91_2362 [Sphingomonas bacterium]|nr:ribonuclease [Sphingomonas bacterium]MDB5690486.1 hypothetical protein [Sphingomonas bacterium]